MTTTKTAVHFTDQYLITPTNPITVNLIGAGGTGSQMLTALARMNHSLVALGHAGLFVHLYDDDRVSEANLGRQLFADAELGMYKSVALINRINRFLGTNWKAITKKYSAANLHTFPEDGKANMTISCVDTIAARFEIAEILQHIEHETHYRRAQPKYWMDMGNSRYTGQVLLSTVAAIKQPSSERYTTVSELPMITTEYGNLLKSQSDNDEPSCSLAEALEKQDLFINSTLANIGASLLWNLFREGMTENRGFFLNLKDYRLQPLKVA